LESKADIDVQEQAQTFSLSPEFIKLCWRSLLDARRRIQRDPHIPPPGSVICCELEIALNVQNHVVSAIARKARHN